MTRIDSVTQFISGTKAVASEINANFKTLVDANNDQETRFSLTESKVNNMKIYNVKDYGAKGDDVTNDTVAIQNALNDVAVTGGVLYFPNGSYRITGLSQSWTSTCNITIQGASEGNTTIRKITTDTSPLLNLSCSGASANVASFLRIKDIRFYGNNRLHDGIIITMFNRTILENVWLSSIDESIVMLGCSNTLLKYCHFSLNNKPIQYRKYYTTVNNYSNCNTIYKCSFNQNYQYQIDFDNGTELNVNDCLFEETGLYQDANSGGIIIRAGICDQLGYSLINIEKCLFRITRGYVIKQEATANSAVSIKDCHFSGCENPDMINLSAGRTTISNVIIPESVAVVTINTGKALIMNSYIATLVNNATVKTEINVQTLANSGIGFSSPVTINNGKSLAMVWGATDQYKHEIRPNTTSNALELQTNTGLNEVVLFGSLAIDGTVGWNANKIRLGTYRLWVDSNGKLRIKNGAPTSDTDGTIVGVQS